MATQYTTVAAAPTYAAPTYVGTTTMAPPTVSYAQAAPVSYAAPMVETISAAPVSYAAPQVTYAAPITTQTASYVAAPQMLLPAPQAPLQPRKLTEGIPTPEQIAQQKAGYAVALDKQLKEAIDTVQKETAIEKQMVQFNADKHIALYNMQVDEKLTEAMALADEQATFAMLELNKAKVERNLQLNAQANGLVMDYEMKAVQTELATKQYQFNVQYVNAENDLAKQYNAQVAKANTGTTYAAPATVVR